MSILNLKARHKLVREYYKKLKQLEKLGVAHEGAIKTAFQKLLESFGKQFNGTKKSIKLSVQAKRAAQVAYLAKRTICQHFGNKVELFIAVLRCLSDRIFEPYPDLSRYKQ